MQSDRFMEPLNDTRGPYVTTHGLRIFGLNVHFKHQMRVRNTFFDRISLSIVVDTDTKRDKELIVKKYEINVGRRKIFTISQVWYHDTIQRQYYVMTVVEKQTYLSKLPNERKLTLINRWHVYIHFIKINLFLLLLKKTFEPSILP